MELSQIPILIAELTAKVEALELRLSEVTKPKEVEQPIDIDAAASYLGLSKHSLYQKCSKRLIPHNKTGKRLSFFKSELADFVKSKKRKCYSF